MSDHPFANLEIRILERQAHSYPIEMSLDGQRQFQGGYLAADLLPWCPGPSAIEDSRHLSSWFFADSRLRQHWAEIRGLSRQRRRIRLNIDRAAAELDALPWELLSENQEADNFKPLAADADTPFSRFIAGEWNPGQPLADHPITLLAAIANPDGLDGYKLAAINAAVETETLLTALDTDQVTVTLLDEAVSLPALEAHLTAGCQLLHLIAHGTFSPKKGTATLFLADEDNDIRLTKARDLTGMIDRLGRKPALIFLASCESAGSDQSDASTARRALAPQLVQAEIPVVLAMQGIVSMATTQTFTRTFYRQLLAHGQVDLAANQARAALLTADLPGSSIPALFSRLPDNRLLLPEDRRKAVAGQDTVHLADAANESLTIYCRVLFRASRDLPLRGVDIGAADPTGDQPSLGLANVYIDLDTTTQTGQADEWRREVQLRTQGARSEEIEKLTGHLRDAVDLHPLPALEAVVKNRRLVLLGDPGGGKSTLVNHLAHCLAGSRVEGGLDLAGHLPTWPDGQKTLPVLIILRDFAAQLPDPLPDKAEAHHMWGFIVSRLAAQNLDFAAEPIRQHLEAGDGLLLFDGLDEVAGPARRAFVRDAVATFVDRYELNRCLITCRTLSYQPPARPHEPDLRLPAAFHSFELAPFDEDKIDRFIRAWYTELAHLGAVRDQDSAGLIEKLSLAVRRPDLWRLAANPLLLTVMALVHTHQGRLPDARALLYEETIDILLWRWEEIKAGGGKSIPRLRQLLLAAERSDTDLKRVLWQLAFEAHAETDPQAEADTLAGIGELKLQKALAALNDGDRTWADQMIQAMKLRAGLLLERAPEVFTFPHRTFQEYLAGAYLSAQADFARRATDLAAEGFLWREVILLAVGRLIYHIGDRDKPLALVSELCPARPGPGETTWRQAWLAGEVLLEMGRPRLTDSATGRDLLERVQNRLAALLSGGHLSPRERAEAGDVLAHLGDPRPGVGLRPDGLPDIEWCEVPEGEFIMGEGSSAHLVTLSAFAISRYPVTNAQFDAFVKGGGYVNESFWGEAKTIGYWRDGAFKGNYDDEPRQEPYNFGSPFTISNHPSVGISWFEALAYCRWLTIQMRLTKLIERGQSVRLPTEAEWEKSARSDDERSYPWGEGIDPNRSNFDQTGIYVTSPIGCFPRGQSLYGCHDMAGSIWEWVQSSYSNYPYSSKDGRESLEGAVQRVLRGGSFDDLERDLCCVNRNRNYPFVRYRNVGFRLVLSPFTSDCWPHRL